MRADDPRRILNQDAAAEALRVEEPDEAYEADNSDVALGEALGAPQGQHGPYHQRTRRPLRWAAALICLALLAATGAERWTLWQEQQSVAQIASENARLERDIAQSQQAVIQAQTPDAIERAARRLGYIRPGETPVIVAQP